MNHVMFGGGYPPFEMHSTSIVSPGLYLEFVKYRVAKIPKKVFLLLRMSPIDLVGTYADFSQKTG